uniref:Transmembrane protein n=1 Tax=Ralstonia solanacearum TaxID=305 RepID=A0A0S4TPT8_RALSL|nr:conserved protein of unknown function [Ralstonia solanacearum]
MRQHLSWSGDSHWRMPRWLLFPAAVVSALIFKYLARA